MDGLLLQRRHRPTLRPSWQPTPADRTNTSDHTVDRVQYATARTLAYAERFRPYAVPGDEPDIYADPKRGVDLVRRRAAQCCEQSYRKREEFGPTKRLAAEEFQRDDDGNQGHLERSESELSISCVDPLAALHIKAEVLRWVYTAGSEKPKVDKALPAANPSSFFSSIFSGLSNSPLFTPPRTPAPPEPTQSITQKNEELLNSIDSSVMLAVYSAHAAVKLDAKLAMELQRSTKKNAPAQVRVDLIYVSPISRNRVTYF